MDKKNLKFEKIRLWIAAHYILLVIIAVVVITLFSIFIAEWFYFDDFFKHIKNEHESNIVRVNAAFLIILTFILVCIAWIQLGGLNKTGRADFLFRIDYRFGSKSIIMARTIIHKIYNETDINCEHAKNYCDSCQKSHLFRISQNIGKMEKDNNSATEFMYLQNFLNFLETIGYFAHKNHVSPREVNELMGGTYLYHFDVFKSLISSRREREGNDFAYCEFEWLSKEIKRYLNESSAV